MNTPENPLLHLRVPFEKAVQVVSLLVEGNGIRGCERLTGLNRRTVLNILWVAGQKCERLLDEKIRDVTADIVQADELYSFVYSKQQNTPFNHDHHGSQFTFLSMDWKSRLIINWYVGKRTRENADKFLKDLRKRVKYRFQFTTDNWKIYSGRRASVWEILYNDVDYAIETKRFVKFNEFQPKQLVGVNRRARYGNPDMDMATICHMERTNLSVRHFTRRFTRNTLGFSKKFENLQNSVALFIAHYNFCRVHSAHGQTPAQAIGLTDKTWTVEDLLKSTF